ncbi:hypothetical protein EYV94_01815 [Puteibacter caeruleilacunae]|nr:hypothetical protein EYV94_01815 [Puteibacter caeruleilacunae]
MQEEQQSISQIRELLKHLGLKIITLPIGSDLRNKLEERSMNLEIALLKLEQKDVEQVTDDLNTIKGDFESVVKDMSQSNKELKKLSDDIEGVAKVLGKLIEIITKIP